MVRKHEKSVNIEVWSCFLFAFVCSERFQFFILGATKACYAVRSLRALFIVGYRKALNIAETEKRVGGLWQIRSFFC